MKAKFFSPTNSLKELMLLEHIEKKPDTTQKEIADIINGARSMVNVYINDLEEEGYLLREYESARLVKYRITQAGIKRKNYLSIVYLQELMKLYKLAEENVDSFIASLEDKGYGRVLLYGAGEVAEVVISVVKRYERKRLRIVGIVDDKLEEDNLYGYRILRRSDIEKIDHDAIVITSYTYEDEIAGRLEEIGYPEEKVERFFTEGR